MQVACTSTADGRIYRFYRSGNDLAQALKPLVPFLLASHADVIVGNEEGDTLLLLRVGPITGQAEALLVSLIGPHLTCRCSSTRLECFARPEAKVFAATATWSASPRQARVPT